VIFSHIRFPQTKSIYFSEILTTNENIAGVSKSTNFIRHIETVMLSSLLASYPRMRENGYYSIANQLLLF